MAKKSKSRAKAYKPKPICPIPITWRSNAGTAHVGLVAWAALNRIVDGSGSAEELGTLAARISHMRAVAAHGVAAVDCEEPLAYLDSAAIAISKSLARFRQVGKVGLSGQELAALRYGLEMADLLQKAATRRELAEGVYATFGWRADIIGALA